MAMRMIFINPRGKAMSEKTNECPMFTPQVQQAALPLISYT